jgi:hypothetical protein
MLKFYFNPVTYAVIFMLLLEYPFVFRQATGDKVMSDMLNFQKVFLFFFLYNFGKFLHKNL